jgi:hypothetical protein
VVDTFQVIAGALEIVDVGPMEAAKMSQRRKTDPPIPKHSRSSSPRRSELIAKGNEKLSAKTKIALDNRFHRTSLRFSGFGPPRGT